MNNEAIERLTAQLNRLQIEVNNIQRELLEATQNNNNEQEVRNQRNESHTHVRGGSSLNVGDKVLIKNKLRLLGISYPKRSVTGVVVRFTSLYVILSVEVPGTVEVYQEVKRASYNLERVQTVQQ